MAEILRFRGRVDPKDTIRRYERLKGMKAPFEPHWEELAAYCAPHRRGFTTLPSPGQDLTDALNDSTAPDALTVLRASLHGGLTPSKAKWFNLRARDPAVTEDDAAREWLDDARDAMYAELRRSNFSGEINGVWGDLPTFGWAALLIEERAAGRIPGDPGFRGARFEALPLQTTCLAENGSGEVDTAYRTFMLGARQARSRWPTGTFSDALVKASASDKEPDQPFTFLHAIEPREFGRSGARATEKPWRSCYLELDKRTQVYESGYDEFPVAAPRWDQVPGEVYGRGPASIALPDIRMLNGAKALDFEAWQQDIWPPAFTDHDGVIGTVSLKPGKINYIEKNATIKPYQSGARYDVTQIKVEDLRASVQRILFADRLQMPPIDSTGKTATEFLMRRDFVDTILGPTADKIEHEVLAVIVWRLFWCMFRAGSFRPLPDVLAGAELDVEYEGALARAQVAEEIYAMDAFEDRVLAVGQVKPEVMDVYNFDKAARYRGRVRGVPAAVLNSEREVAELRDARAEVEAEEEATQLSERAAGVAGAIAPALKALGAGAAMGA